MAYKRISPQPIVEGGTGVQSNTAYAVLCGGTTSTSGIQSIASVGTANQVLTSNGAGSLPTFQNPAVSSAITSITGNAGGAQSGPAITLTGGSTGASFGGAANTITMTFAGITANGGTVRLATDATNSNIDIATGAGVKNVNLGSTNTTSSTTIFGGSNGINITAATSNGDITLNSGTASIAISTNAAASTVNVGTGAGAKTVTVGSTNTTSSLDLKYGTSDFTIASATGTVISALDTGEVTMPIQPAFFAYLATTVTNVTGDGTFYTIIFDTEVYDQSSDFNLGTSQFVAPVTGRYHFACGVGFLELGAAFTDGRIRVSTSNRIYQIDRSNYGAIQTGGVLIAGNNFYADMDAGDTAVLTAYVGGSTKTIDIFGDVNAISFFSGVLVV